MRTDHGEIEGYGLSVTSPVVLVQLAGPARKAGTIGTAIDGVEGKVVDGEVTPLAETVGALQRPPRATSQPAPCPGPLACLVSGRY